jgi:hypothetical protein
MDGKGHLVVLNYLTIPLLSYLLVWLSLYLFLCTVGGSGGVLPVRGSVHALPHHLHPPYVPAEGLQRHRS